MNKQMQQDFLNECVSILREVEDDKFDLSVVWSAPRGCGCVMGHYKIRHDQYEVGFTDRIYIYHVTVDPQGRSHINFNRFLTNGLKFDEDQLDALEQILGFDDDFYKKPLSKVTKGEVLGELIKFMEYNEFEIPQEIKEIVQSFDAFDAMKSLLR